MPYRRWRSFLPDHTATAFAERPPRMTLTFGCILRHLERRSQSPMTMIFHKLTINRLILLVYLFAFVYLLTAIITRDWTKFGISVLIGSAAYSYLLTTLWRRKRFKPHTQTCSLEMRDDTLICHVEERRPHSLLWRDIHEVTVHTLASDDPLLSTEIWLRLHSYPWRKIMDIPSRAQGFEALVHRLSDWENFDAEAVHAAFKIVGASDVTVWKRPKE